MVDPLPVATMQPRDAREHAAHLRGRATAFARRTTDPFRQPVSRTDLIVTWIGVAAGCVYSALSHLGYV